MSRKKQTTNIIKPVENSTYKISEIENKWNKIFSANSNMSGNMNDFFMNSGSMFVNDPYLLNQRMKQLKTMSAFFDREAIEHALVEPEFNEMTLRGSTHSMLNMTYPLYKLQMLYEGILSYHSYVFPKYVSKTEMNTPRFKSDDKLMDMWLKKLAPEKQFRRMVAEIMAEGKRAYFFRQSFNSTTGKENVDYVHWQEIPSDWVKIIKKSTNSHYVVAFNFAYFWMAGTSLGQFPPFFAEAYSELMGCATLDDKKQIKSINTDKTPEDVVVEYNAQTMKWYYWKELPDDDCYVFSFDESHSLQFSPFASLLLTAQDLSSYSLLQQQLLAVPLYSIILGEMPMQDGKTNKPQETDDYRISPDAKNLFEGSINGRMPPGTSYAMTPTQQNKLFNFQEVPNANKIYGMGLEGLLDTSGANTLLTTNPKPSVAQSTAGRIIETRYIDRIYEQFKQATNIQLKKMYDNGNLKYEWRFALFGDVFSDKDKEAAIVKELSLGQKELIPEFLSYHSLSVSDALNICDWIDDTGLYQKFEALVNSFTSTTGADNKNGRPAADQNNIQSDGTDASLNSGGNTGDMRDFSTTSIYKCATCGEEIQKDSEFSPFCCTCYEKFIEIHADENLEE